MPPPPLLKAALVAIDSASPLASVIVFQYNPETLTRTLKPRVAGREGDVGEAYRIEGPPEEFIRVEVEIDATDQLERGDPVAESMGIYPQLSALEMLVYPKSSALIANRALLALGTVEVVPPPGPFTVFIWGPKRALPVRLQELSITEEAHDADLNPLRAKVSLGLAVLSYHDLPMTHPGYSIFLSHQVIKEAMAVIGGARSLGSLASGGVRIQ